MQSMTKFAVAAACAALASGVVALPASAGCTRLGFTVNDYGKDGPTRDAKELLDKHIAKKMAERGVSKYQTGKKSVSCELFLNFIVFDEHTCTAEATVCWDGSALPKGDAAEVTNTDAAKSDAVKSTSAKPKEKSDATAEKSAESAKDPATAKVTEPTKVSEPAKDLAKEKAPEPAKAEIAPKSEAEPAKAPEQAKSADTAKPAEPVKSSEAPNTPEPAKAAEAEKIVEPVKPIETGSTEKAPEKALEKAAAKPAETATEKSAEQAVKSVKVKSADGAKTAVTGDGYPVPQGPDDHGVTSPEGQ